MGKAKADGVRQILASQQRSREGDLKDEAHRQPDQRLLRDGGEALKRQRIGRHLQRSEEHTSELQSLMRISYAVFCLKKKTKNFDTLKDSQIQRNNSSTTVTKTKHVSHLLLEYNNNKKPRTD